MRRLSIILTLLTFGAGCLFSAEIVPPRDLGELARMSNSVVLARAASSRTVAGPYVPHTVTRFERIEQVGGEPLPVSFEVSEPGGTAGKIAATIDGSPKFTAGDTYLLFLDRVQGGPWCVWGMAWGAFVEARGADGAKILEPIAERKQVGVITRFDVEIPGVYREADVIAHLREVIRGRVPWNGASVLVPSSDLPSMHAQDAPSVCAFMTYSQDGDGIRWFGFADGTPVTVMATTPGQEGLDDGGTGAVSGAAQAWSNDPDSKILLNYGGTTARNITCSSGDDEQDNAVIFNDPCDDIAALDNCSGTLAYGGPIFSTATQDFDGSEWHPALKLFVVVNDGAQCIGAVNFAEVMTHELGHGLGFGHHHDSDATMYSQCCHYPRGAALATTDSVCASYLYPEQGQASPPAAPGSLSVQATGAGQLVLQWSDRSSDEDGFHVYRSTGGVFGLIATTGADVETYTDGGAAPCAAVQYRVTAFNGAGESAASNTVSTTVPGSVPGRPTALRAVAPSSNLVELDWMNAGVNQDAIEVGRATGGGAFVKRATLPGASTHFDDHGVSASSTYQYRVRATNACGPSEWSQTVDVTVPGGQGGLTAEFTVDPIEPWAGEEAAFTPTATGSTTSFAWSFGDGGHAEGEHPTHTFVMPGTYTVTLTVRQGSSSATAHHPVTVLPAPNVVPAAAHTPGNHGTFWKTDLALLAPPEGACSGRLVLRDQAGHAMSSMPFSLGAGRLLELDDVVSEMLSQEASGSLGVEVTSGPTPIVTTRTFTAGDEGTFGQSIPLQLPQRSGTVYLTGIRGAPGYRTDFGVTSASDDVLHVTVRLFTSRGQAAGPTLGLTAHAHAQWNLASLVGAAALDGVDAGSLAITIDRPAAAYVSIIDNDSGDPAFVAARRASRHLLIPIVGRGPGRNGTSWDSDLTLFDPGPATAHLQLVYLPADRDNSDGGETALKAVGPGETLRLTHVLQALWGVEQGVGSIRITSDAPVAATARVVTPRPDGPGTMGQTVPAIDLDHMKQRRGVIAWVRWGQDFRTNAGLVNLGSAPLGVTLRLHNRYGSLLSQTTVTVPAASLIHRSLEDLFGSGTMGEGGSGWIEAVDAPEDLVLYATQVDNLSGDPVNVAGE